ncbi:MAG: DNA methyltransferase [Deinococcota bacterium]
MRTFINIKHRHDYELPEHFQDDDVRFSGSLVRYFLNEFTQEGDIVFDPFAGYGTTLFTAQDMARVPYGIEYSEARYAFIQERLHSGQIIHGDSLRIPEYNLPRINMSITSPPYTRPQDPQNPLKAYQTNDGNYEDYLKGIQTIYGHIAKLLEPTAHVIIEVSNLKHELGVTPLAWHIAEHVSEVLRFEGEIIVCRDNYGFGYDHGYCLLFSAR